VQHPQGLHLPGCLSTTYPFLAYTTEPNDLNRAVATRSQSAGGCSTHRSWHQERLSTTCSSNYTVACGHLPTINVPPRPSTQCAPIPAALKLQEIVRRGCLSTTYPGQNPVRKRRPPKPCAKRKTRGPSSAVSCRRTLRGNYAKTVPFPQISRPDN